MIKQLLFLNVNTSTRPKTRKLICFSCGCEIVTIKKKWFCSEMLVQCVPIKLMSTSSTQCDGDPVCFSIELSSTQFNVDPVCVPIELSSTQCDVDPACVPIELSSTQCDVGPVYAPIELSSTQCDVGLVCVSP